MAYATPETLRERYRQGLDRDEFGAYADADLEQAINAAGAEIDRWRPAGTLSAEDLATLQGIALPLARAAIYKDQALDQTHPISADAAVARAWLKALAAGQVRLPSQGAGVASDATPATPRVGAPGEVFGADFIARYRGA